MAAAFIEEADIRGHRWHVKRKVQFLTGSRFFLREFPNSWQRVTSQVQGPAFFLSYLKAGDPPQDTFMKIQVSAIFLLFTGPSPLPKNLKKSPPPPVLSCGRKPRYPKSQSDPEGFPL